MELQQKIKKLKLKTIAADIDTDAAKIIEIVKQHSGTEKKPSGELTLDEADIVLERIIKDEAEADSPAAFFALKRKPEPKPEPPKPVRIEKHTIKSDKKPPVLTKTAPPAPRPPQPAANSVNQPFKPKKPTIAPAREVKAMVDITKVKANEPPRQKQKGEAVERAEQVTKVVDTRGSYVEIDKYNEKYDRIASSVGAGGEQKGQNAAGGMKQKFAQKPSQKPGQNRPGQQNRNRQPQNQNNRFQPKPRETEQQRLKRIQLERAREMQLKVLIPDAIVVSELAQRLKVKASDVIKRLFNLGVMATINEIIDFDAATLVAEELGAKVEREQVLSIEDRLFEPEEEDLSEKLVERAPVVVVMGHVDHGKTSLLDKIRNANVVSGEAGGITQHIGAYRVKAGGRDITFLDTPGHEAFTAMRARGASVTDVAILVVAADDGIMPQTIEAINHAKAAGVSVIVAINKIDKPGANPDKIRQELTKHEIVVESFGGDVICCEVSAKKNIGIDNLLEMVSLTADVLQLKANPNRNAGGAVIEAHLDKGRGPVATLLVQKGTLKKGDVIIAGMSVGHVRIMKDDIGRSIDKAGPSVPVEITGLSEVPMAGDSFAVVENEKLARELVEKRRGEAKEEQFRRIHTVTKESLDAAIAGGSVKELRIIIKADVQGSAEAVRHSLEKLSNNETRVKVLHCGVGAITETDVSLAASSGGLVIGFNVRPLLAVAANAKRGGVDIKFYSIIYNAIEEVTALMKGMVAPKSRIVEQGKAEVRSVFKITGVGAVAGCYVLDGKITNKCEARVLREGIVIAEDKIAGLKRFKDDVKEVAEKYECGITLAKFADYKEGDIIEAFITEEYTD
ncbi:MAG: translation initiation factor IF-2 [Oscillospiraceae bacterium]|jgi:translation initiation factor IF-2|nr:translation initiation factor IF-2 [Oscillospiraceae bacterium]